jgi:hypothetical protein
MTMLVVAVIVNDGIGKKGMSTVWGCRAWIVRRLPRVRLAALTGALLVGLTVVETVTVSWVPPAADDCRVAPGGRHDRPVAGAVLGGQQELPIGEQRASALDAPRDEHEEEGECEGELGQRLGALAATAWHAAPLGR